MEFDVRFVGIGVLRLEDTICIEYLCRRVWLYFACGEADDTSSCSGTSITQVDI